MALPNPGMTIDLERTALLITDPQNDFLSPGDQECGWKIAGRKGAAVRLGLNPSTLRSRIEKLGISKPSRAP